MWKQPDRLAESVRKILKDFGITGRLAVTMTGELADCFASRGEGVYPYCRSAIASRTAENLSIYSVDGHWVTAEQAKDAPWSVAASNWHALATWLAQLASPLRQRSRTPY